MDGAQLWRAVEDRLQSPVRKSRSVIGDLPEDLMVLAGESALARYTMLAEPKIICRAVPAFAWKRIAEDYGLESRSEEHTSELQSLMRISYAVFCLKKKKPIKLRNNI